MISTVIFDMDGVIIDSEPVHFKIEQKMFNELGLELTQDEHAEYVGRSDLWDNIKAKYGLDHEVNELHEEYQKRYLSYLKSSYNNGPINGVADLIKTLSEDGFTLVLASSSTMNNIHLVLQKFNLTEFFPFVISGADLETSKPHPEIFLEAAKMAEAHPGNCLVIEDSYNGVRAAKAAGMRCIGYKNPNSGNQDLQAADWIIENFDEFDLNRFDN